MQKGKIAVTPLYDMEKNNWMMFYAYMTAIEKAGGIPFMLPPTCDETVLTPLLDMADGLMFTGGQDIDPALYGEEKKPYCDTVVPERDSAELWLFEAAVQRSMPVFGTCRGLQVINVACGGTLYQDLPKEHPGHILHRQQPPYDRPVHSVAVDAGSPLRDITGADTLQVNSYHHQAIKELAPALRPVARSDDGLVEGAYLPDHPFVMALQWHPEWMTGCDEASRQIFRAFVEACGRRKMSGQ